MKSLFYTEVIDSWEREILYRHFSFDIEETKEEVKKYITDIYDGFWDLDVGDMEWLPVENYEKYADKNCESIMKLVFVQDSPNDTETIATIFEVSSFSDLTR